MTEKEALLHQLDEYNVALEHLRRDDYSQDKTPARKIARQLSHLEQRVLQVQTQLNFIDLRIRYLSRDQPNEESQGDFWAYLNPWHPSFHIWAYVAVLALFMLAAIALQVILG